MAKRGPKPKPTKVLKLRGSRKIRQDEGEPDGEPLCRMPQPPSCLTKEGKQLWQTLGPKLRRSGLLTDLDVDMFELLCDIYGEYKSPDANEQTPSYRAKLLDKLVKLYAEFGLSPSSRSRVTVEKPKAENPFEMALRNKHIG